MKNPEEFLLAPQWPLVSLHMKFSVPSRVSALNASGTDKQAHNGTLANLVSKGFQELRGTFRSVWSTQKRLMFLRLFPRNEEYRNGSDVPRATRVRTLTWWIRQTLCHARVTMLMSIDAAASQRCTTSSGLACRLNSWACQVLCDGNFEVEMHRLPTQSLA
jgi:hypothetical protein